ncbi:sodium/calcium exchanger 1-like [Littorina saxatilis]|uniref:Calx-beta domain-containing protein n=1 Tax=Littorina saxatilis TaxID=31220 RepID=A0AAN9GLL1_9CAEN
MSTCDLDEYLCSDKGLLLPFVNEYTWSSGVRAFMYFFGLLYCFLGVSIIADVFMRSIEMITSKTSTVRIADSTAKTGYRELSVKVWNDTVANLTLMALGSSAPEILLSVIEVVGNSFKAGSLGPGTIVGSAAFNLLVITGVCVVCLPAGEIRRIKTIKVFVVTAIFSVFAYLWLLVVLVLITPDYVDLWEAIVTFLFFPLLVVIAYMTEKDYCCRQDTAEGAEIGEFGMGKDHIHGEDKASKEAIANILRKIGRRSDVTEEDEAKIAAAMMAQEIPHNRGWYRMNAIRNLSGGSKLTPPVNEKQADILNHLLQGEEMGSAVSVMSAGGERAVIQWASSASAVLEKDGEVSLILMRTGNLDNRVLVRVETIDGTAEAESDYIPYKETLVFEPGETSKNVDVKIVDDNEWEPDEVFFVKLAVLDDAEGVVIGKRAITQVTILNDDSPGTYEFSEPSVVVKESVGTVQIPVSRTNGADGRVVLKWEAKNQTAVYGRDYDTNKGTLVFEHGQLTKTIEIGIIDDQEFEKDEHFEVSLVSCDTPGAKIGKLSRTIVTILNDDDFRGMVSRVVNMTNTNLDMLQLHKATWGQQFTEAMNVNGGEVESATAVDYVLHFLTFGWKVLFAAVPPPNIWGGWLSFFVSLGMIGILTTFINDLASIFGCIVGLKDTVTAITLVALGTSLPDLFASKQAAVQEKYADNCIGNVTGSNSVNVFMGVGVSWTIASIYWSAKGTTFEVQAGSLSFSVVLYVLCAVLALSFLMVRRYVPFLGKAELGGPAGGKWFTFCFFISLWLLYIILSSMQAYEIIDVGF